MSVQFSELHGVKGRLLWSPSGELLATTESNQLMIRSGDSLQIIGVHSCIDVIDKIEWSSNSEHILCLIKKRGLVMVWSVSDIKWEAKIEEGVAGLSNAFWSPDCKHILTVSEFEIRLTIWSLVEGTAQYIKYPKHHTLGIKFSPNGEYLAVAERSNHIDILGIYSVRHWQLIHRFNVEGIADLHDVTWSPDGQHLFCRNSELSYKFAVYSPRGRKVFEYAAYDNALGIRCSAWSPNSKYLAVGSYDDRVRIFNTMTWRIVSEFGCGSAATDRRYKTKSTICYQEVAIPNQQMPEEDPLNQDKTRYVLRDVAALEIHEKGTGSKSNKKQLKGKGKSGGEEAVQIGVAKCEWSHDSRFLAVISDSAGRVVWIWDLKYLVFHSILAHKESIRAFAWNTVNHKLQLAISCNNDRLYLWSKSGAVVIRVVASRFNVRRLSWRPTAGGSAKQKEQSAKSKRSRYQNLASKDCICLIDRNHFCAVYDLDF